MLLKTNIISKICGLGIISITYIYSSKIGKDIWNGKIECRKKY